MSANKKAHRRNAPSRVDLYFEDFLAGMRGLNPKERGVYWTLCCLLWSGKGKLVDDDEENARACGCSAKVYLGIKAALIAKEKITVADGLIRHERAESEWNLAVERFLAAKFRRQKVDGTEGVNQGKTEPCVAEGRAKADVPSDPHQHQHPSNTEGVSSTAAVDSHPQASAAASASAGVNASLLADVAERLRRVNPLLTGASIRRKVENLVRLAGGDVSVAEEALERAVELPERDDLGRLTNIIPWAQSRIVGRLQNPPEQRQSTSPPRRVAPARSGGTDRSPTASLDRVLAVLPGHARRAEDFDLPPDDGSDVPSIGYVEGSA